MLAYLVDNPIADPAEDMQERVFRPLSTDTVNNRIPAFPRIEELLKHFRRILQIGVYLHDGITTGMEVICQDGALETKVFRKPDGPYTSIAGGKIRKDFPGPVTGMVVRKD